MPSFSHTPEALLGRNDSKNPTKTCKGITNNGRPCRRALGKDRAGVVAVFEEEGTVQEADFYCWQHKDQAEVRVQEQNEAGRNMRRQKSAELFPLQERSSIDTLMQRLDIREDAMHGKKTRTSGQGRLPKQTDATDFANASRPVRQSGETRKKKKKKKPSFWASLCCVAEHEDDYVEIVRHRRRMEHAMQPQSEMAQTSRLPRIPSEGRPAPVPTRREAVLAPPPNRRTSSNPQTNQFLSLIPEHCSPHTTSALLAELSKPISAADEEGYIYIFWLTPQSKDAPGESTARSLLSSPDRRDRRLSDVTTNFSYDRHDRATTGDAEGPNPKKTIMLKIGRANNVTRRMNEWQRQCGYKLTLVRWYPHVPSSTAPSPQPSPRRPLYPDLSSRRQSDTVRKVPCVKRVERLIHLELAEQQVKRHCDTCGKEHREWFEVKVSQEGVRGVDECVKRWVEWAERGAHDQ